MEVGWIGIWMELSLLTVINIRREDVMRKSNMPYAI